MLIIAQHINTPCNVRLVWKQKNVTGLDRWIQRAAITFVCVPVPLRTTVACSSALLMQCKRTVWTALNCRAQVLASPVNRFTGWSCHLKRDVTHGSSGSHHSPTTLIAFASFCSTPWSCSCGGVIVRQPAYGYRTTTAKPQRNTNTHRTRAIQPMK